jgi:hypothetical protein
LETLFNPDSSTHNTLAVCSKDPVGRKLKELKREKNEKRRKGGERETHSVYYGVKCENYPFRYGYEPT